MNNTIDNIDNKRPTWDEYFLKIATLTSERSNCIKRKVGCIIVKDNRILCLGYNGTPKGIKNCFEGGCDRCNGNYESGNNLDICMCLHAEENALLFLSQKELIDSTLYVTLMPCISCTKKIIQCGIKMVIYIDNYNKNLDIISLNMLKQANIIVKQIIQK
jgi:dCMP deaminase